MRSPMSRHVLFRLFAFFASFPLAASLFAFSLSFSAASFRLSRKKVINNRLSRFFPARCLAFRPFRRFFCSPFVHRLFSGFGRAVFGVVFGGWWDFFYATLLKKIFIFEVIFQCQMGCPKLTYSLSTEPVLRCVYGGRENHAIYPKQNITYTDFNKAKTIAQGDHLLNIDYGPDRQRVKSVLKKNNSIIKTVIFAGNYERIS